MKRLFIAALLLCALSGIAKADGQGVFLFNSSTTGSADTAVTVTIPALVDQRGHIYGLDAWCSAGTATLSVTDGGTTIWTTQTGEIDTTPLRIAWTTGLTGSTNSALVATLTTCGAGNTGTLIVQADRY